MGIFTKETRTVFRRNEAGEVTDVEHIGNAAINYERKSRWNEAKQAWRVSQGERGEQRAKEKKAYKESYNKARIDSAHRRGASTGKQGGFYMPNISRFTPPQQSRKSSGGGGFVWKEPFTSSYKPKKKKQGGKRYAVVGGKAYPVAGSSKKKHKSKKKVYRDPVQDYMRRIGL